MKRKASVLTAFFIICTCLHVGHTESIAPAYGNALKSTQPALVEFEWYNDFYYTDYTGVTSSVSNELARLRDIYSGYVFSASPAMGLSPFEWGYHPYYANTIIYSNYY
jgi:hypothetical protein